MTPYNPIINDNIEINDSTQYEIKFGYYHLKYRFVEEHGFQLQDKKGREIYFDKSCLRHYQLVEGFCYIFRVGKYLNNFVVTPLYCTNDGIKFDNV